MALGGPLRSQGRWWGTREVRVRGKKIFKGRHITTWPGAEGHKKIPGLR